jgi:hypothetical protein
MIVGSGKFRYRVNADWAKLPAGWSFKEVGGVGVDRNDNVYVFNRCEHPMMERSWGEGQYPRAHGVHMAPDDTMFLTDPGIPGIAIEITQWALVLELSGKRVILQTLPGVDIIAGASLARQMVNLRLSIAKIRFCYRVGLLSPGLGAVSKCCRLGVHHHGFCPQQLAVA